MEKQCRKHQLFTKFFLVLSLVTLSLSAFAQGEVRNVAGTVTDTDGNKLAGVTVLIPGTPRGTSTDANGSYVMNVGDAQYLEYTCLGYKTQRIKLNGQTFVDVIMEEDRTSLEEIVVVGYGVQKRRDIIGAIESINTKEIEERTGASMNISRSLQGAIPGLTLTFSDGKPNRGATVRIRGVENSIGSGGSAMVLVDGVEADDGLQSVNPEDIESITVLKDASSTAVYGARGTFGVILLTTKTPQTGTAHVTYNGTFNVYRRSVIPTMVTNGYDYTTSFLESYLNGRGVDPANINNVFPFSRSWYAELERRNSDPSFEKWRINSSGNYEYFGNTNWYDLFYNDYFLGHQHNLTVQGGSDKASYYVSGRIFTQDGIYREGDEKFNQYNLRTKGVVHVKPWLKVEQGVDFLFRISHQPQAHTGNSIEPVAISRMLNHQAFPVAIPYNPDGTWTEAGVYTGYAGMVEGNSWRDDRKMDITSRTAVTLDIIKNVLVANADFDFYYNQTNRTTAVNPYTYYTGIDASGIRPSGSMYEERTYHRERLVGNATLQWTPHFHEDHYLSIMGGWNIEDYRYLTTRINREGIMTPETPNWGLMDGESMTITDNGTYDYGLVGAFYRVNYSYKSRYLIEASGRYDGNSKFPANSRWGFFPSGSVGWRISEENFLKNAEWLDNLKIRFSVGSAGNGLMSSAYAYLSTMSISQSSLLSDGNVFNYTNAPTPVPEELTFETALTYDLGLDFEALDGRLNFVGDIYRKNTLNMYVTGEELPAVYGNSAPKGNYADMRTDGWEVSLSWRESYKVGGKNLSYNLKAAVWDNVSTITRYTSKTGTLPTIYSTNYYEGMVLGEFWGYTCNGLYQTDQEAQTYADLSSFSHDSWVPSAGDPKFEDLNGDGAVNNGNNTIYDHGDLTVIGNTSPRYCYSLQGGISWNGIGLSFMFQGVGKRDWYPAKESGWFWGQYGRPYSMSMPWHSDRWSEDNPNAYWPRLVAYQAEASAAMLSQANTRYMQSARYLRLKNVTVDYSFSSKICKKIGLQALKVYVTLENPLTFTPLHKYAKNYDPEGIYPGDADYQTNDVGADNYGDGDGYPVLKSYTIGLSITL